MKQDKKIELVLKMARIYKILWILITIFAVGITIYFILKE